MKTKQELLDFYGVEAGKKYKVIKSESFVKVGTIFTINNECQVFYKDGIRTYPLCSLDYLDYEELTPPILTDEEREYLQHYVMDNPAFKGKVVSISKNSCIELEWLSIEIQKDADVSLPYFKANSMYKGMKLDEEYTPRELGLEE